MAGVRLLSLYQRILQLKALCRDRLGSALLVRNFIKLSFILILS